MFYEESEINEILQCEKCKNRLNEPRILPCGKTICKECVSTLQVNQNRFKCILCEEENHFVSEGGLLVNQIAYNLLLKNPIEVSRGGKSDQLNDILKRVENKIFQIQNVLYNPINYIKEYCMNLENEVQLAKEEIIQDVEEYHQELSKKIDEYKIDCISKMETKKLDENQVKNSENLISELKSFKDEWSSYLSKTSVDDKLLCEANDLGEKFIKKSDYQNDILELLNFDRQLVFHKCEGISMNTVIGLVNNRYLAYPLTTKQENDLFELCNLDPDDNWILVYQATRDGFSASDFHSKCDSKTNTLVVVKSANGNIFGGYTQHDWSGSIYKNDPDAFIFSLINEDKKPICMKTSNPKQAVCSNPSYGPTFGGGHDFYICSNSNTVNSSYSNLNNSYVHPTCKNDYYAKSFLAGSYNFLTLEILVFSKNE